MKVIKSKFVAFDHDTNQIICHGEWILNNISAIKSELKKLPTPTSDSVTIDANDITKMDSAGAWSLLDWINKMKAKKIEVQLINLSEQHQKLLSLVEKQTSKQKKIPGAVSTNWFSIVGKKSIDQVNEGLQFLSFTGLLTIETIRILIIHPTHFRFRAIVNVIDKTGMQALPIVALLSFMIGIVISYQMGNQLRAYGANVFIVDLLGLSVLREFGPLITAIMVAGRSGSAITAQLGIMKINQEIDALNTMGVTPAELLLLPRVAGLLIALPLLTMWADIFGVFGGMVMANNMLHISWYDFLVRFQHEIPVRNLLIGIGKAPVFALLVASIGCFEGMQVKGSAETVGLKTTRSVVLAIFFIIIVDAVFSVIFSKFKL